MTDNTFLIADTPRLSLRPLTPADAPFIFTLVNTPSWLAYIGDRHVRSLEDAERYLLNGPLKSYSENGYGAWMVMHKETNQPIGMCGLFKRTYLDSPDLGFAFLPQHEGKGYAWEAAVAALIYTQKQLGIDHVFAIVQPDNRRSIRLLEKIGFMLQEMVQPHGEQQPLRLYRLSITDNSFRPVSQIRP